MFKSLDEEAAKQLKERAAWSDEQLLNDVAKQFTVSLRMLSGNEPEPPPNIFEMMKPRLRNLLCPHKQIFDYPESDLVLAVCAVFLEVYSVHLAGSLAVYVCRKGIRVLCP
jgi:hypothetical protein